MKRFGILLVCLCFAAGFAADHDFVIAIHGGAGAILKKNMTPEKEKAYFEALERALEIGYEILAKGGSGLEAVEKSIAYMEDSPLFNAGKGSVFTHDGTNELDASIMDGKTLKAGAVAGVKRIKNPISLARMVMEKSVHVMLTGEGAETFAKEQGVEWVDPSWFHTKRRWDSLQKVLENEKKSLPSSPDAKHGTVGVVVLDKEGNLYAGTSTGGMTNKKYGRVGDSPIIGAGTYADNESCAVSATGHGEYFIRVAVTHEISALMKYAGLSLQGAADRVIHDQLLPMGGTGGVVAVDHKGNVAMSFNTQGMYRGYRKEGGKAVVKIYE